jgi:autotransporter-associated beta strand protein
MPSLIFRTRFFPLAALAAAVLTVAAGTPAAAATITWESAQNITDDSDVLTTGSLVYAYNFGEEGVVTNTTVNGVVFAAFGVPGFGLQSVTLDDVTISEFPAFISSGSFFTTSPPFSNLSTQYRNLLGSYATATDPSTITLALGGLTPGKAYDFQWWTNHSANAPVSTTAFASNSISLTSNTDGVDGSVGQFAIGRFTASGTTQSIDFSSGGFDFPLINGFQLRLIASGPNALIWNTTDGTWNTTSTVWTTGTGGNLAFIDGDSVTFSGTGGGVVTLSGSIQPSSIEVSATSGTYSFVSSAGNLLTGTTGLAKSGGGTLILSGSNAFTGATTVTGGVLLVNGVLSSTTTTVSAVFGGAGTVGGDVQMAAGGTLAPGATVGSTGTLTMNSLSGSDYTIAMQITGTGAGQYDQIVTLGNLAYSGTLNMQMSGGAYTPGDTFDLFAFATTSGTLSGIDMAGSSDGWENLTWFAPGQAGVGTYDYGAGIWQSSWATVDGQARKLLFNQNDGSIMVVPEPSTFVMAGGALAGYRLLRRRRRAGSAAG